MTALLGLLAVAGYQHRDKIAELLGSIGQSTPAGTRQSTSGDAGQSGIAGLLGQLSRSLGGASAGGLLSGGLGELLESFKQSGHGETAESWVGTGPNKPVTPPQLEQAIRPEVLEMLSKQTGCRGKSCSRGCPANSPTRSINIRRTAGSRRKRTFRVRKAAIIEAPRGEQDGISTAEMVSLRRRAAVAGNKSPDHQDNYRSDHCPNQASAFVRAIPAYRLAQISGQKSSYYPENCGEDEPGRFVIAGRDELRDHTCDEPNDDRPDDVHGKFPLKVEPGRSGWKDDLPQQRSLARAG